LKRYYRLNLAGEKKLFKDYLDDYYGICIGAHIFAHGENWITAFLEDLQKPFFIDPLTYLLNQSIEKIMKKNQIRKSFTKLLKNYSEDIQTYFLRDERSLEIKDFIDNQQINQIFIDDFVKSTLDFQRKIGEHDTPSEESVNDFLREFSPDTKKKILKPEFLVTPYFYFSSLTDKWYIVSKELAKSAISQKQKNEQIYGIICMSSSLLKNPKALVQIINDFNFIDGFIIWISNFNEYISDIKQLYNFIIFIKLLSKLDKPIINLYGGYFSIIVNKFGLEGAVSGICYSESKDAKAPPPKGGGAPLRYYIKNAKFKVVEANARRYYGSNPIEILCNCDICNGIKSELVHKKYTSLFLSEFFKNLSSTQTKEHFILNRSKEETELTGKSINECIQILEDLFEICQNTNCTVYKIPYLHIKSWIDALKKTIS